MILLAAISMSMPNGMHLSCRWQLEPLLQYLRQYLSMGYDLAALPWGPVNTGTQLTGKELEGKLKVIDLKCTEQSFTCCIHVFAAAYEHCERRKRFSATLLL